MLNAGVAPGTNAALQLGRWQLQPRWILHLVLTAEHALNCQSRAAGQEPLPPACHILDQHTVCMLSSGGQPCTVPAVSTGVKLNKHGYAGAVQGQLAAHEAAQQAQDAWTG